MTPANPNFPALIVQMEDGKVHQSWKNRGEAMDGSGVIYLHRSFRNTWDGKTIEVTRQVTCYTEQRIKQLLALPQTFARSN